MNEFERAVVNDPSVFEPLKFYCTTLVWMSLTSLPLLVMLSKYCCQTNLINSCYIAFFPLLPYLAENELF